MGAPQVLTSINVKNESATPIEEMGSLELSQLWV